jgi:CRISPR system Cascade subunit CasA
MGFTFNLVDQGFIPCARAGGTNQLLGVRDALTGAAGITEIAGDSPVETLSLHRLLLAILHRAINGPKDIDEWALLWDAGAFALATLEPYLAKSRGLFDLFDPERPFMQARNPATGRDTPINKYTLGLSAGNNPTLFDHTLDSAPKPRSPAESARFLLGLQLYGFAGLSGLGENFKDGPLTRYASLMPVGRNLFETLMLNLVPYDPDNEEPFPSSGNDAPSWELNDQPAIDRPRGYLDYLTWQSRSVKLLPEELEGAVVVKAYRIALGRELRPATPPFYPGLVYTKSASKKPGAPAYSILKFDQNKALWRDSTALFESLPARRAGKRLDGFNFLADLTVEGKLPRGFRPDFAVLGLCTEPGQQKVYYWRHERMTLPTSYLRDAHVVHTLGVSLDESNRVEQTLSAAIWRVAKEMAKPLVKDEQLSRGDGDAINRVVEALAADRLYWSRLEIPFRRLFVGLGEYGADRNALLADWREKTLFHVARTAFCETAGRLDRSARVLRAVALGQQELDESVRRVRADARRGVA